MLIPLPFVTALVCAVLALRLILARAIPAQARALFAGLALCTVAGSVLVGIRFGYGAEWLAAYHRVLPLFFGPALYLGFAAMTAPVSAQRLGVHVAVALTGSAIFSRWVGPLDLAIALSYLSYWALLFRQHRSGPDGFALLPTMITEQMHRWRRGALVLLAAIFVLENTIAATFMLGLGRIVPQIIAWGSLPIAAALLVAALNAPARTQPRPKTAPDSTIADIEAHLTETEAYRDPDLSLSKLARGLGQPIRSVSQRINQASGQSVSLYINDWRIKAAAKQLRDTRDKVEVVAQDCGFLSRSNFYREFQRVHQMSPAAYRKRTNAEQ